MMFRIKAPQQKRNSLLVCAIILLAQLIYLPATAGAQTAKGEITKQRIVITQVNPNEGRILFVKKACVLCHAVNGVGGKGAPALDAAQPGRPIDPIAFFAGIWQGADAMIFMQSSTLGYVATLTAQEIGDLAAFAGSKDMQADFSMDEVPEYMRDWFVDDLSEWAPDLFPEDGD